MAFKHRDDLKAQLLANREGTLKAFKAISVKTTNKNVSPMPNRKDGQPPIINKTNELDAKRAKAIRNRAQEIKRANKNMDYSKAWDIATREQETV